MDGTQHAIIELMVGYIIIGALLGLPLLLGIIFRAGTSFLFLSLLAGELLARTFGDETELIIGSVPRARPAAAYAKLAVLLLPVLLTALFLRHTLSKGKVLLHLLPLVATGVILAAFALPILPEVAQAKVKSVNLGHQLLDKSEIIVGIMLLLQLIALWLLNRSHEHSKKKHH